MAELVERRHTRIQVGPHGTDGDTDAAPESGWTHGPLNPTTENPGEAVLRLEREDGVPNIVDETVSERLKGAIRHVFDEPLSLAHGQGAGLIEPLFDRAAQEPIRMMAISLRRLNGEPRAGFRIVGVPEARRLYRACQCQTPVRQPRHRISPSSPVVTSAVGEDHR